MICDDLGVASEGDHWAILSKHNQSKSNTGTNISKSIEANLTSSHSESISELVDQLSDLDLDQQVDVFKLSLKTKFEADVEKRANEKLKEYI
jgi:hypothetical protein